MKVSTPKLNLDFSTKKHIISFEIDKDSINEAKRFIDEVKPDKFYRIEPKLWRDTRSLSANAYFWTLCGKLAKKLQEENKDPKKPITDIEIYRGYIRDVGVAKVQELDIDFAKSIIVAWKNLGTGKGFFVEEQDIGKEPNTMIYKFYYGSSVYNSKQMARLIDLVITDCKEQGIETMTPTQIDELKARWGE